MQGDPLRKLKTGDVLRGIPKEAWNAFIDAARRGGRPGQHFKPHKPSSGVIRVKNISGSAQPRFAVLGIDSPVVAPTTEFDEFKQRTWLKVTTPTTASHTGKFVVTLEPLKSNAHGLAVIDGAAIVQVTGTSYGWAELTNSDSAKLTCSVAGTARILWADSGSSLRWAVVRLAEGPPPTLIGKLDGNLAYQGSATMSVWTGTGAGSDSGENITVYDWVLSTTQTVLAGTQVAAFWEAPTGVWRLLSAQCA